MLLKASAVCELCVLRVHCANKDAVSNDNNGISFHMGLCVVFSNNGFDFRWE